MDRSHRAAEEAIKKGPWTAEEDEVLINFVNKYGPRDWSSIRSMGLLPRTGKSCRLRWVNKLRPNLKIGCKFSAEEERVVIELQERFGNKWATIASYLPGRTDNDVKNFWSTRQKRLARILQSPQPSKSQKNKGKAPAVHEVLQEPDEFSSPKMREEPSPKFQYCPSSSMGDPDQMLRITPLPDLIITPKLINLDPNLSSLDSSSTVTDDQIKPSSETPLHLFFPELPNPNLDLPLLSLENHDPALELAGADDFLDAFAIRRDEELDNVSQLNLGSPFLGELEGAGGGAGRDGGGGDSEKLATPDSFFDELPADIFDYLEVIPGSSPL